MPKKVPSSSKPRGRRSFSLLEQGASLRDATRQSLIDKASKVKHDPGRYAGMLANHQNILIPIPNLNLRHALGIRGFQSGKLLDIIGADSLGKTSLALTIGGWFMQRDCPVLYIETEGKPLYDSRIKQCLSSDRKSAEDFWNNFLIMEQLFGLSDIVDFIRSWVQRVRNPDEEPYLPQWKPIMVIVDTFSKAQTPSMEQAMEFYTDNPVVNRSSADSSKKPQLVGGSNMERAKAAHQWMVELPAFLIYNNVFMVTCRHQNESVDMGGGSFIPAEAREAYNRTSPGGRAINQNASYQLILTHKGIMTRTIKGQRVKLGPKIQVNVYKNTYGPSGRVVFYKINSTEAGATDQWQPPAIDFRPFLPDVLNQTGLVSVQVRNAVDVSCPDLGPEARGIEPEELATLFYNNHQFFEDLSRRCGHVGFGDQFWDLPSVEEETEIKTDSSETENSEPKESNDDQSQDVQGDPPEGNDQSDQASNKNPNRKRATKTGARKRRTKR